MEVTLRASADNITSPSKRASTCEPRRSTKPRQLLRETCQTMKCGTYAAYGCVDSSGEQCSYKQRCFLGGDLACINSVMHAGTEASRREVLSAALLNHVRL